MTVNRDTGDSVALIAHALADPRRYAILKQIANESAPVCLSALRREHAIGAPTMSHHLKLLAAAGLIAVNRQGKRMEVALRPEILARYLQDIGHQLGLT
jgi:DNA-binding transcriptional ArsR family regulator